MAVIKQPENDQEMLMHLATEGKEHENVDKTIYMIKTGNSFEQNEKALGGASKDDLKRTYAFLLATTVDNPGWPS